MLKTLRRILSLIVFLIGVCLLVWASLPSHQQVVSQYLDPSSMQVPSTGSATIPAILEMRQVRLEWPASMRIGDQSVITLRFEPITSEIITPKPEVSFSDVYNSYSVMVEGRYEVAGVQVNPVNSRRESLLSGQSVKFTWQIRAQRVGSYPGELWLSLRFLPLDGSQAIQVPVYVHELDIQATSILGMNGLTARLLGGMAIIMGLAFSYDVIISLVKKINAKGVPVTTKI